MNDSERESVSPLMRASAALFRAGFCGEPTRLFDFPNGSTPSQLAGPCLLPRGHGIDHLPLLEVPLEVTEPRDCKHCHGTHPLKFSLDGSLLVCSHCGAGLAPASELPGFGDLTFRYDEFCRRIEDQFNAAARARRGAR